MQRDQWRQPLILMGIREHHRESLAFEFSLEGRKMWYSGGRQNSRCEDSEA